MKYLKILIGFLVIFAVTSGIVFAKSGPYVTVFYVEGKAAYLPVGESEWKALKAGISLYSGDSIKTYEDSSAEIAFDDKKNNVISVRPSSHVVLKLEGTEKMELIDGEVFALINKISKGSTFEIRTPTAVCGARGTGFGAKTNKNETTVSGYEDDSYAKGLNKDGTPIKDNITVKQGFKTIVKLFQRPTKLFRLSKLDMERWYKWKNLLERLLGRGKARERLARNLDKILNQKRKIEERQDTDRINKRTEKTGAGSSSCPDDYLEDDTRD